MFSDTSLMKFIFGRLSLESIPYHEPILVVTFAVVATGGLIVLGLITYFTAGPKEARAWTIGKGWKAPQAAGVIHTDFQRGFIRAETIAFDDYVSLGGEAGAKDAGKLRQEGKEYLVQDGDVMMFKFNV